MKKSLLCFSCVILLSLFALKSAAQVGTWTALTNAAPHSSGGGLLLLSDGTVLAKSTSGGSSNGNVYDKLTPNANGSYVNGTWSSIAAMNNTRLYYSSQVLMDGRVYVAGGEYGTGGSAGETYNPLTNVWTNCPSPGATISDANSEILPDGRVLQALVQGSLTGTDIYNPVTNTYSSGPTAQGIHNESAWVKLPDNSILYVNRQSTSSERYIPSQNQWITDATVPVSLYDQFGLETGAGLLLPDGRAFFLGATGHTAYYTPSGTTSNGAWAAGPDIPNGGGTPDAPAAMMVNGKILCNASPVPTSGNHFPTPTTFYEFDYTTNSFTAINAPGGGSSLNISTFVTTFLDLPDGRVLYAQQNSNQYYIYTPNGSPLASGKPTISNIAQTNCTTYTITGTGFNGISEGAAYGDDWQMASNYPLVRLSSGTNVYYARTFNWNSTGVKRGSAADTAKFTLPSNLPVGTYSLVVVANGISSDQTSFTPSIPSATAGSNSPVCAGTTLNLTSSGGVTYSWSGPNSFSSTQQNPNITNVAATAAGTYTVTVTNSGGCSATATTAITINTQPTVTTNSNSPVCAGNTLNLSSSGGTSYLWIGPNSFASTFQNPSITNATVAATGTYTVTVTGSNGCTTRATVTATVNSNVTAAAGSNSPVCAGSTLNLTSGGGTSYSWTGPNSFTSTLQNPSIANATIAATGTYTVTVTSSGCSSKATTAATVNPLPTVAAGNNGPVCAGSTLNLTSGGGGSYSWAGPNSFNSTIQNPTIINASIAATGTYTVTVTSNGCTSKATTSATVNALPTAACGNNGPVCAGNTLILTSSGGATYSWTGPNSFNSSLQNPAISNISIAAAGTYTVIITSNGCSATATTSAVINTLPAATAGSNNPICSGSTLNLSATGGTFYSWIGPNNFTSTLQNPTISNASTSASGTYSVTVTNSNGCSVIQKTSVTVNSCTAVLNLKAFLEGFYTGAGTMRTTLYNLGYSTDSTATDSIEVNLWDPAHLANNNPDYPAKVILHKNGNAVILYPSITAGNNYYIQVRHRNSIETWSKNPVTFASTISYDFTTAMSQAYDNGFNQPMKTIGDNVFTFYAGDVNHDGTIDASDMANIDNGASIFLYGYNVSDCSGNGATDIGDMSLVDNNIQLQIFFARP